jgi:hypothetical protein
MSRSRKPDPTVYTITKFCDAPATEDLARMSPWRKATIAVALATSPAPVIATILTGQPGWTAALFVADVVAVIGTVVSHAHSESPVAWRPEAAATAPAAAPAAAPVAKPIEASWDDVYGNRIVYQATPGRTEAA